MMFEEKMKKQEQLILEQYIEDNKIEEVPLKSGMYYIENNTGKGKKAVSGNILTVHYTGKFINGKIFDSSYNRNIPFSFRLGERQVIKGWEDGFSNMKRGGKAVFIIPSELAYGKEGYSTIIPPYTSLIFEVELLEIK